MDLFLFWWQGLLTVVLLLLNYIDYMLSLISTLEIYLLFFTYIQVSCTGISNRRVDTHNHNEPDPYLTYESCMRTSNVSSIYYYSYFRVDELKYYFFFFFFVLVRRITKKKQSSDITIIVIKQNWEADYSTVSLHLLRYRTERVLTDSLSPSVSEQALIVYRKAEVISVKFLRG